jgi:tetratricopeptide (TPR) repeat protein
VTTATDVYSLGVLLFELLTGTRPFAGRPRTDATEPPRASTLSGVRALRGDLDRILLMALETDPGRRYGSVEKFADDVRRHLDGHPVSARGASLGYRAAKFARRNKLGVTAAAVALLAVALSFAAVLQPKRIAERRFEQVRSLAHSVVFDLHDAIARLPGSTPARELLVRKALGYLDALAAESSRNGPLQMELAGAYERVGDVQGMPYRPNLGDTAGALASYHKALSLAGPLREAEPENAPAARLLADVHDRIGWIEQRRLRFRSALQHHEAARELREALPSRTIADDLAAARTWVAIGDCLYLSTSLTPVQRGKPTTVRGAYETAVRIVERVPPRGPHRKDLLTEIGRAHQRLGGYFTGAMEHDEPLAMQHHEAARRAIEERAALDPSDGVARRNYADHLVMMATLHNRMGDGAAALGRTSRALVILKELAAADPNNVEAQHDLAFCYEQTGAACLDLQRWSDARAALEQALAIRTRLIAADPTNREDRRGIPALLSMLGDVHEQLGDKEAGKALKEKGRVEYEKLKDLK